MENKGPLESTSQTLKTYVQLISAMFIVTENL